MQIALHLALETGIQALSRKGKERTGQQDKAERLKDESSRLTWPEDQVTWSARFPETARSPLESLVSGFLESRDA